MKNILLIIGMVASTLSYGQIEVETEELDTTRFTLGEYEVVIINHDLDTAWIENENSEKSEKREKRKKKEYIKDMTHWSGFEFGPSVMMNSSGGTDINKDFLNFDPAQSFSYSFNFAEKRIPFGTDYIGLTTGLGLTHSRYGIKDNYVLQTNSDSTWGVQDTVTHYNKNQIRANYLTIPLLIAINTSLNEKKNFHIEFGAIGGVRFKSKTVQKFDVEGKTAKNKTKAVYNLNPFQLIGTVRVGFNNASLFANYNLLPLFDESATESVYPLTVGLSLHF